MKKPCIAPFAAGLAMALSLTPFTGLHAQTLLFSDSFDRADNDDISAATNGMGGLLLGNGTFSAGNVWLEPVDVAHALPDDARILSSQLKLGGNGHTVHVVPNHNFAGDLSAGVFAVQLRVVSAPEGSSTVDRYAGIGIGGSLAELTSTVDQAIPNLADLFVGQTSDGRLRINDEDPALRPGSGMLVPTTTIDLDPNAAAFIPGILRVELTVTNTTAGSTVIYDVFFDDEQGGGFVDVLPGTRSFTWSGNAELHMALAGRSTTGVVVDDFQVATSPGLPPVPHSYFADEFGRPDNPDLSANTNGMGGILLSNGMFTVGNVWLEPVDGASGIAADSQVLSGQLMLGGNNHTVHVVPKHNFAEDFGAGFLSVSLRVVGAPTGTVPVERYSGIGVGGSLADMSSTVDQAVANLADLLVAETADGQLRLNDDPPSSRPGSGVASPTMMIDLDPGATDFIPGILRVDLVVTNTAAGSTVVYDLFFDDGLGGGFVDVLPGTRSFVWSGSAEVYVAVAERSTAGAVVDDFEVSLLATAPPLPQVVLAVVPDTVLSTNTAQPVTLTLTSDNLTFNCTYAITADQAVTFPGGGQTGPATNGSTAIAAIVDGSLGDTTFTVQVSNASAQLVATDAATIRQTVVRPATAPNVLVILYDDTGWGDFGCYGSPIRTPNIDSLATNGLRFRNFYNTARCSTTRCALLTGNYNQQVAQVPTASLPNLRTDNNITIAELLGMRGPFGVTGYRTYMAGKWHIGTDPDEIPRARGFDHAFGQNPDASGANPGGVFDFWDSSLYFITSTSNAIPAHAYDPTNQFHYSDAIGDYCVDFLNHHFVSQGDGRPFFMYMPFNAPHWPVNGPAALANHYTDVGDPDPGDADVIRYEVGWDVLRPQVYSNQLAMGVLKPGTLLSPKNRTEIPSGTAAQAPIDDWDTLSLAQRSDLARRAAVYASMIELDDQNIGKVITRLKELGQFDNTLIFILCDNGANYEGGEFGNSNDSNFTPWDAADLPAMGGPKSAYDALGIAYNKYPRVNLGGAWANLSNTPFRFYKHFNHNGGIASPLVVHWPAGMSNSVRGTWVDEKTHLIDIMATIADVTGAPRPTNFNGHPVLPAQGISLKPVFAGQPLPIRDIGLEHEKNRAYFRGRWKLVTRNFALSDGSSPAHELELYDTETDPVEIDNRAAFEPAVLAEMVDAWNAWSMNVGLPVNSTYLLPALLPPQLDPAPLSSDLFVDNFNRPASTDADAAATGMSGSRVPPLGAGSTYFEGYETGGAADVSITNAGLRMAVGGGTSECGINHNFTGQDITDAGGFSVQLRIDDINPFTPEVHHYAGFAVGLTAVEAAAGADIASPGSFRGNGVNPGVADCFIELDYFGNVKMWSNGVLLVSVPMHQNHGTLLASFATTSFNAGSAVAVSVTLDGQPVDLDPDSSGFSRTFVWQHDNANYIGLSARATGPAASFVKVDNLAIRKLPVGYSLALEYAMDAGLSAPSNAVTADPDADGDNNLVEWLKGGRPGVADPERHLFWAKPSSVGDYRFGYYRLADAAQAGVEYSFKCSADLVSWAPFVPEELSQQPDATGYERIEGRVPAAVASGKTNVFVLMEAGASGP